MSEVKELTSQGVCCFHVKDIKNVEETRLLRAVVHLQVLDHVQHFATGEDLTWTVESTETKESISSRS